jgi:hypothetical protein
LSLAIEGERPGFFETKSDPASALRAGYQQQGCCRIGHPIVPPTLLERARSAATALACGEFAPGRAPWRVLRDPHPGSLLKIDQPHLADSALFDLITCSQLGGLAAELTGEKRVQAWATQLLVKPPGGFSAGCVGWHTDQQYWPWFRGGVFTIWVALEDILPESGPVRLLAGSHRWPEGTFTGDALDRDLGAREGAWRARLSEAERAVLSVVDVILPAGGVAVFDGNLLHCSGPNTGSNPRRGVAIHLCSEQTQRYLEFDDYGFVRRLDDRDQCPVVFGAW